MTVLQFLVMGNFNNKIKNETLDVVTVNLKVIDIIKKIETIKKIKKSFVNTKILNQLSYVSRRVVMWL